MDNEIYCDCGKVFGFGYILYVGSVCDGNSVLIRMEELESCFVIFDLGWKRQFDCFVFLQLRNYAAIEVYSSIVSYLFKASRYVVKNPCCF